MLIDEQLYELDLPPFDKITTANFTGINDNHLTENYITLNNLTEIIKPEYLNIAGLNWTFINYFKKSDFIGSIHRDTDTLTKTIFSINWVTDGDGKMDFWDESEVTNIGYTSGSYNNPDLGIVPRYKTKQKPCKSYMMYKDHVYLVNASIPHRAIGSKNRKVYSLRTGKTDITWDDALILFQNLIKK